MSLQIPLNLCFCLLFCLVAGSLVDGKPGNETLRLHSEDEDHHHMLKLVSRFNVFVANSNKCPPNWMRFQQSCYRYVDCPKSFEDAEVECRSYGWDSHLVSIHNSRLGQFLVSSVIPDDEKANIWIGGSNVNQNCDQWRWTDGSQMDYFSWGGSAPDSCQAKDVCLQLSKSSYFQNWVAVDCSNSSGFICKNDF